MSCNHYLDREDGLCPICWKERAERAEEAIREYRGRFCPHHTDAARLRIAQECPCCLLRRAEKGNLGIEALESARVLLSFLHGCYVPHEEQRALIAPVLGKIAGAMSRAEA